MINRALIISIALVFFACAKPNYQTPPPIVENDKQDLDTKKCELFFKTERLCLEYKWITRPTTTTMGNFEFKFYIQEKPNEAVKPNNKVDIVLWMPSMAHGSRPVQIEKDVFDIYTASKIFFIMPGEWEIRFQLKEEKNVVEQLVEKITL